MTDFSRHIGNGKCESMDIIIVANFTGDFTSADNGRYKYLAEMLADGDNDVEILTSSFDHDKKRQRVNFGKISNYRVTLIEEPGYPQNICLKRFQSHYIWGKNVEKYIEKRKKPDIIYCAVPSLTGPNRVAKYCEKNGIRFIIDVQDLWPEAFRMVIDIPLLGSIIFVPFKIFANGIYKRADAICAVSDTYGQRALKVNKKCTKTITVFLGTELKVFDCYAAGSPILTKKKDEIWLAYCGTLGSSYDLSCVFDALNILKDERVRFVIMGDGPKQNVFRAYAKKKGIYAIFVGRLQYNQMCSLLSACDIAVNPITHKAAQSIINKHADYAAAGLPVVSTQESDEYKKLINDYEMGFNCRNNDAKDLADKIKILVEDIALRQRMGRNSRLCAKERFDRVNVYQNLKKIILDSMEST